MNILSLRGASIHTIPSTDGDGFDLHVVTPDGHQATVSIAREELEAASGEVREVLNGQPRAFVNAGMRLQKRLTEIKSK